MKMSFQSLLQRDGEEQRWAGNGWGSTSYGSSHGLQRLRSGVPGEYSFVGQDGGGGEAHLLRSGGGSGGSAGEVLRISGGGEGGGGSGGVYRGDFAGSLALNTSGSGSYGADLTLFSPSELFSPASRQQQVASPFSWQSLSLGGGNQAQLASVRWQPDATPLTSGFATFGGTEAGIVEQGSALVGHARAEDQSVKRVGGVSTNVGNYEVFRARESSGSDGVVSEVEVDPSGGDQVKEEWAAINLNREKENWRKFGDFMVGDVKQEESENIQEAAGYILGDGSVKSRKRRPEVIVSLEPSASSSESDSDSEELGRRKGESLNRKRNRPGQDADGNVTWTDESVRFLFETYDAIHHRLWEESKGQVKYQKKWTPILKAMQARFGNHFTKKQCQSKYWSVRRECTEYRIMSTEAAATDPMWNPSIAGRELLKPKFYDVWLDVSGKNEAIVTKTKSSTNKGNDVFPGELLKGTPSGGLGKDGRSVKQRTKDSGGAMKEMQRLMVVELQASEKREEAMKYRAEIIMELLTQHIEHVENRVTSIDESRNPQLLLLERVNVKLEKVLDSLSALNQHLSKLHRE